GGRVMSGRVLVVDDEREMCEAIAAGLGPRGYDVCSETSAEAALATLEGAEVDVVLTYLNMRGMDGLALCERIVASRPDVPVVVITGVRKPRDGDRRDPRGAYDFITKPVKMDALAVALSRAVQHRSLREEVKRLRHLVGEAERFDELVGNSGPMLRVRQLLDRVIDSDASVLVTGESGTGKEVVARVLHRRGRRKDGPFVAVNCAAMPEQLLESELFGHVRGAFTDARAARTGLFVQAHRGTLLLDEIGELPLALQPKLLRALQERAVRRVGGNEEVPFDVHLVATTNRDLESAVEEGRFRGPLLPRQRDPRGDAAAPRARERRAGARPALPRPPRREGGKTRHRALARGGRAAPRLCLAGQRARAPERDGARRRARAVRSRHRRRPAREDPRLPTFPRAHRGRRSLGARAARRGGAALHPAGGGERRRKQDARRSGPR